MSTITQGSGDWAGQGTLDQARHRQRVKEAIKDQLADIVSQTPIISGDPQQPVKVPVKILDLPHFRPARDPLDDGVGIGQGPSRPGDVVGQRPKRRAGDGPGQPGTQEETVTLELSVEDLMALVFEVLGLPNLRAKRPPQIHETDLVWNTRQRKGSMATLDKPATLREAVARSLAAGQPLNFAPDDLRYRAFTEEARPVTNAVIYLIRDLSYSMEGNRTYLARTMLYWLVKWVQWQYPRTVLEWWGHDVAPVDLENEAQFFAANKPGGTLVVPTYTHLQQHMQQHYPPGSYNVYVFHATDGEIGDSAGDTRQAVAQWLSQVSLFAVLEMLPIKMHPDWSWQLSTYCQGLPEPFRAVQVQSIDDVAPRLREILGEGSA